tara:strand:- start:89 stop:220 length:132 start_codon:yes stop_codon:yes gene_type:complete
VCADPIATALGPGSMSKKFAAEVPTLDIWANEKLIIIGKRKKM